LALLTLLALLALAFNGGVDSLHDSHHSALFLLLKELLFVDDPLMAV
jgi:hypothetical protein